MRGLYPELRIDSPIALDYDTAWELAQVYILSLQRKGLLDEMYQGSLAVYDAEHMIWFFRLHDSNMGSFALDGVGYTLALSAQTGGFPGFQKSRMVQEAILFFCVQKFFILCLEELHSAQRSIGMI